MRNLALVLFSVTVGCTGGDAKPDGGGQMAPFDLAPVGGPIVVGACDKLPQPGVWEEITPPGSVHAYFDPGGGPIPSGIPNFIAQPLRPGTVLVGGVGEGLFETKDCGATWVHLNTGINGDKLEDHHIADPQFTLDPSNADVFYIVLNYGNGGVWKTTNGGVDWKQTFDAAASSTFVYDFVNTVALDPTDPQHLVATPHGWCVDGSGNAVGSCGLESKDGGDHWTKISVPNWMEGGALIILGGPRWLMAGGQNRLQYTDDSGTTWTDITPAGTGGANPGHYYSELTKTYYLTSDYGMMRSTDQVHWTKMDNSPVSSMIVGTGKTLYVCHPYGTCNTAPESDPQTWTPFALPQVITDHKSRTFSLTYDSTHHVLYAGGVGQPGYNGGLYRMVLE